MQTDKFSSDLVRYLQDHNIGDITVILELIQDKSRLSSLTSRKDKIDFKKQQFSQNLNEVLPLINRYGGNLIDSAWLNSTLKVTLPTEALHDVAQISAVEQIDIPHKITLE